MSCEHFEADLSAWIDGELPAPRAAQVEAHVAACVACRARVEVLRSADAALGAIPLREMPPGALAQVLERAEGGRGEAASALARARWLRWAAAPAAAAAGLAVYLATRPDPLESASAEDLAVATDLDTVEDLEVIANLELLEAMVALDEGRS